MERVDVPTWTGKWSLGVEGAYMNVIEIGYQFVAKQWANITTTITTCKYSFLWLVIEPNYVT